MLGVQSTVDILQLVTFLVLTVYILMNSLQIISKFGGSSKTTSSKSDWMTTHISVLNLSLNKY